MKTIFALCGLILIGGGIALWLKLRLPDHAGTFTGAPKAEVADLIDRPKDFLHKTLTIEGVVRKQCTAMGCFFYFESLRHDDKWLRVDLADIAMNAPRRNGHKAKVEGQMVPYNDGYQFWASGVDFE